MLPRYLIKWTGTLVLSGDGILLVCSRLGCWSTVACVCVLCIINGCLRGHVIGLGGQTDHWGINYIICRGKTTVDLPVYCFTGM